MAQFQGLKMCPEIVARSPGCKERWKPKTGAYLDVCEDFRRDPRRRRLGPQQISGHIFRPDAAPRWAEELQRAKVPT